MLIYLEREFVVVNKDASDINAFISNLMLAYREGKHLILIEPIAIKDLLNGKNINSENKGYLNHYTSHNKDAKSILKKFCTVLKIITSTESETIYSDIESRIEYRCISYKQFLDSVNIQKTVLLAENGNDSEIYALFAKYFKHKSSLSNLAINYKSQTGGGDTTAKEFEKLLKNKEEICLCIIDSDKKCPDKGIGETAKKVKNVYDQSMINEPNYKCHYDITGTLELENLLPKLFFKKEYEDKDPNKNGIFKRIEYLLCIEQDSRKYIDLKEGIKRLSDYTEDTIATFWGRIIISSNLKQGYNNNDNLCYIPGYGNKILVDFLKYNENDIFNYVDLDACVMNDWYKIGQLVASYVAGSNIKRAI